MGQNKKKTAPRTEERLLPIKTIVVSLNVAVLKDFNISGNLVISGNYHFKTRAKNLRINRSLLQLIVLFILLRS